MDAHAGFVLPVGWNVTREKEEAACLKSLPCLTQRGNSVVEVRNGSAALPCLGGAVLEIWRDCMRMPLVLMDTRHTCLLTMDTQIYIGDKVS